MPVKARRIVNHFITICNKKNTKNFNFLCRLFCDFACPVFYKFAKISREMKKFLLFVCAFLLCMSDAGAAERGANTVSRAKSTSANTTARATRTITSRTPLRTNVTARTTKPITILTPKNSSTKTATRTTTQSTTNTNRNVTARATKTIGETRTGAEYEQCKSAFFMCMDQFCQLKDDSYRRCSCSNRVFDFQDIKENYQQVHDKLSEFSDNLGVVGLTREQAIAMKTSSEGEDALMEDKSASKQLLQAIMNSIRGESTTVTGKYQDLNTIFVSADMSNAFEMDDMGQIVASYNGAALYKAVYSQCRNAIKDDCNNASLQRAVNAYLMAIEQDCNTVESALEKQQKLLKSATHESSAMLDLARVENRQNHNSDDIATCLANVETAIKSDQVCGEDYHKCLDYGQFIDVTTGAPLTGVADFYKLGEILTFRDGENLKDQKLSTISNNRAFVQFFESKTKKFAKDSLDKCTEDADFVWREYLDKALLDIYYAQQDKVQTIKQSCLSLVAKCYENQSTAINAAMANLTGDSTLLLRPSAISLTTEMCSNYIDSCNRMFNNDIIQAYIDDKDGNDSLYACRAIAKQCFDSFGGTAYNNLYYTQSGLFSRGHAMDWFSLYEYDIANPDNPPVILSPCAQQVANTPECADKLEIVFGGFNKYTDPNNNTFVYSSINENDTDRKIRTTGVASEIYYKILDTLSTQCTGKGGYFIEYKYAAKYGYKPNDLCKIDSNNPNSDFHINPDYNSENTFVYWYHFLPEEDMCPLNYGVSVDTQSWGICSCWENGGYRSKNGTTETCRPILPALSGDNDPICSHDILCQGVNTEYEMCDIARWTNSVQHWCQQPVMSSLEQICPTTNLVLDSQDNTIMFCADDSGQPIEPIKFVPNHKVSPQD